MQVIGNAEIELPIFEKVGIRGVVFTDVGNSFNLENQYCDSAAPTLRRSDEEPVQARRSTSRRLPRQAGASASAGSRPSARCVSSGASRSGPLPGANEQPIVFEFTIGNFF